MAELLTEKDNWWIGMVRQAPESGHRRNGGRYMDFREMEKEWRLGPTDSLTINSQTGSTLRMGIVAPLASVSF